MCSRCGGQLLRSYPGDELSCLQCGYVVVEIPEWVKQEYDDRFGRDHVGRQRHMPARRAGMKLA